MTDGGTPIQISSARFRVDGTGRGQGIVLLYPDKLAAVNSYTELWGIFLGSIVLVAISSSLFHDAPGLGSAVGVLAGGWIGPKIVRKVPAAPFRVAVSLCGVGLAVRLGVSAYR